MFRQNRNSSARKPNFTQKDILMNHQSQLYPTTGTRLDIRA